MFCWWLLKCVCVCRTLSYSLLAFPALSALMSAYHLLRQPTQTAATDGVGEKKKRNLTVPSLHLQEFRCVTQQNLSEFCKIIQYIQFPVPLVLCSALTLLQQGYMVQTQSKKLISFWTRCEFLSCRIILGMCHCSHHKHCWPFLFTCAVPCPPPFTSVTNSSGNLISPWGRLLEVFLAELCGKN